MSLRTADHPPVREAVPLRTPADDTKSVASAVSRRSVVNPLEDPSTMYGAELTRVREELATLKAQMSEFLSAREKGNQTTASRYGDDEELFSGIPTEASEPHTVASMVGSSRSMRSERRSTVGSMGSVASRRSEVPSTASAMRTDDTELRSEVSRVSSYPSRGSLPYSLSSIMSERSERPKKKRSSPRPAPKKNQKKEQPLRYPEAEAAAEEEEEEGDGNDSDFSFF